MTDLPSVKRAATNVYREILSKKLTYDHIKKSKRIAEISDRLIHYKEMLNVLNADSLFFKSLHRRFKGIVADCVLTKCVNKDPLYSFLFLVKNNNVYCPCSFFTRNEKNEYTKEGTHWKIATVEEIYKK